jgi:DNA-binding response OmpR family regulator
LKASVQVAGSETSGHALSHSHPPACQGRRPDVPVIMITAYGDAETKKRALENGAEALLTKPIDFVVSRDEIESRLRAIRRTRSTRWQR